MVDDINKIPVGEGPLTNQQLRMLRSAAGVIVPADDKGAMPGAAQIDMQGYLTERPPEELQMLVACVDALAGFVAGQEQASGGKLDEAAEKDAITSFAGTHPELWQLLVLTTYSCYYQDESVLLALGMDPSPPFPRGNEVEPGDLSLLDPVRKRKSFYR